MKIYTKQGDAGMSALFNGQRVPKHHLRLETYGTLDELNSFLGLAITHCRHVALQEQLAALQNMIFVLCTDLATPVGSTQEAKVRRIDEKDVRGLEEQIDAATAVLPPLKRFILPGGGATAGYLHVARTVCRRAERHLSVLMDVSPVGPQLFIFVNRLSDLLFTLARLANQLDGIADIEWNS